MPSLKLKDNYVIDGKKWSITNLLERVGAKKGNLTFVSVDEVDLEDIPPPRKDLHQNRYGICRRKNREMFLKILSPGFYSRAKKFHTLLKPHAKDLFVESYFDDENRILAQPRLGKSIKHAKLKKEFVKNNVKKIKKFVSSILQEGDDIIKCFRYLDVAKDNFMLDRSCENLYLVDFDPWTHLNQDSVWDDIAKEISS